MSSYRIKAKNDLHNKGQVFTKDKIYEIETSRPVLVNASLMDMITINDKGEKHLIGSWWREFDIEKTYIARSKNEEEKFKAFSYEEARHWVINHLDTSLTWDVEEQNY